MRAQAQAYRHVWDEIARRGWEGKRDTEPTEEETRALRNYFYDSLFDLPDGAGTFVRRWFRWRSKEVQGLAASDFQGRERWPLISLFLKEVLGMEQARIEAIRRVGDALGQDIVDANDRGLFRRIFMGRTSYRDVRGTLIRANNEHVRRNSMPLLTLDDFLLLFEEGEEVARVDWQLAWDLLRIRTTEALCKSGWFEKPEAKEVIEEVSQQEEEESEATV
jgi:CRISPR-associated protein Cst1